MPIKEGYKAPSLGFKPDANHAHLGHFTQEKFLRDGHNTSRPPKRKVTGVHSTGQVVTVQKGATARARGVNQLSRRTAKAAIRSGNASVAAERPVLAARLAAKVPGASRKDIRSAVKTARKDPNSRRQERLVRRGKRVGRSVTSSY